MLTGPESCGKTTLAGRLAGTLRAPLVPEVSRDYLHQKISRDGRFRYSEPDLLAIASQQHREEAQALAESPHLLVCDTDLLVLIVWSEVRFGQCHPWILDTFEGAVGARRRHYLLCDWHVPWEPDPLREDPDSREELFALYEQKLAFYGLDYTVMTGDVPARLAAATALLENRLATH